METRKLHGTSKRERGKRWFFDWQEQWSQFVSECNWYTFNFCKLEVEHAPYSGRNELTVFVLGLGFTLTYVFDQRFNDDMHDMIDDIRNEKTP